MVTGPSPIGVDCPDFCKISYQLENCGWGMEKSAAFKLDKRRKGPRLDSNHRGT